MIAAMPRTRCFTTGGEQEAFALHAQPTFKAPLKARRKCWDSGDWMLLQEQCQQQHQQHHQSEPGAGTRQDQPEPRLPIKTAAAVSPAAAVVSTLPAEGLPRALDVVQRVRSWQPRPSRFHSEASRIN